MTQPAYGQQPYQQPAYGQGGYQAASVDTPPPYLQASYSDVARNELAKKGQRDIVFGAIWLAVGIGITVVTLAMMDGAAMVVAWGPALYGLYKIIKGLITVARNS